MTDDQLKTAAVSRMAPEAQVEAVKAGQAGIS
jgi:hypothetical protein